MWSPDVAVSHTINVLADLIEPGWAECVSVCVLHVHDIRFIYFFGGRGGGSAGWVLILHCELGDRGVRGELKQRDGLHLSARPTLKWPSLRID